MIAKYPKFTPVDIKLKTQINKYNDSFIPYSDFNFTSLLAWNTNKDTEVSLLNNNLVIKLPSYTTGKTTYSLLGINNIDESINTLLELSPTLEMVPETVVNEIANRQILSIKPDRNNFDYIYRVSKLARMAGKDYKKKRNKANTFIKAQTGVELNIQHLSEVSPKITNEIVELDKIWAKQTKQPAKEAKFERQAIQNILDNFSNLNCTITVIHVDDRLVAFSINEVLSGEYAICHFEKALKIHHQHIYTFLAREVAKDLHQKGCVYVNWEQDLGISGIRRSKKSYNPTQMLKKYTISKRS